MDGSGKSGGLRHLTDVIKTCMVNGSTKTGGAGIQVETVNWSRNQGPERKREELKKERIPTCLWQEASH